MQTVICAAAGCNLAKTDRMLEIAVSWNVKFEILFLIYVR